MKDLQKKLKLIRDGEFYDTPKLFEVSKNSLPKELKKYYSQYKKSIVRVITKKEKKESNRDFNIGTGFFITDGILVTCAHCLATYKGFEPKSNLEILYKFDENEEWFVGKLLIVDKANDIAIISATSHENKVKSMTLPSLVKYNFDNISSAYVFGYPHKSNSDELQFYEMAYDGIGKIYSIPGKYMDEVKLHSALVFKGTDESIITDIGGMSGGPIIDAENNVIAIHGYSSYDGKSYFAIKLMYLQDLITKYNKSI